MISDINLTKHIQSMGPGKEAGELRPQSHWPLTLFCFVFVNLTKSIWCLYLAKLLQCLN